MYKILGSYYTMLLLLIILAIGAATGTFIENNHGNAYAKAHIYASWWYQGLLLLASINLIFVFTKLGKKLFRPGPIFHFAFVVILLGAFVTHHFGLDGSMHIREGEKSNVISVNGRVVHIDFSIELKDFTLKRYPGSRAPSEFKSDVVVKDVASNTSFEEEIYMNNTLTYKGYKFFQTSYDEDEKGTILSVNKDPGVLITYIGYALLFLGLLLTLFDENSRVRFILNKIKHMPIAVFIMFTALSFENVSAQQSDYVSNYLTEHKEKSKEISKLFGSLIVQGPTGRMKPLDTQNKEILTKLTGRKTWNGMNANQVLLGMSTRPDIWKKVNLIRVKTPRLRKLLGVSKTQKLVPFSIFFNDKGAYKLTQETERANNLTPSKRGTFERDLIRIDELLNIAFMSYKGMLFKIFPIKNDPNNQWEDFSSMFSTTTHEGLKKQTYDFMDKIYSRDYVAAAKGIEFIKEYQLEFGTEVIPVSSRVEAELLYNKTSLFIKLSVTYLLLGLFLIFYGLISMFHNRLQSKPLRNTIITIVILLFAVHTFGIALRWYIGGYAPISNTYETMVYIAYSAIIAALLFLRKSILGIGASLIMAGVFLFSAYLGEINPQITSLVPVLKSYWLSIHVSVITASYGFLGVSAILGLLTLLIFILRNPSRKHLDIHILNITYINEFTIIIGIILLTTGNFLGAIWANESWGRYWGWDPKETWTYISIIVYTIVLHLRFMKKIYSHYLFAISAVLAFFSILMTYYGVNYYLSGMHSYATGDPIPIPNWVYILVILILIIVTLGYKKRIINK